MRSKCPSTQQWHDHSAVTSMSTAEHQPKLLEALRLFRPTEARDRCSLVCVLSFQCRATYQNEKPSAGDLYSVYFIREF